MWMKKKSPAQIKGGSCDENEAPNLFLLREKNCRLSIQKIIPTPGKEEEKIQKRSSQLPRASHWSSSIRNRQQLKVVATFKVSGKSCTDLGIFYHQRCWKEELLHFCSMRNKNCNQTRQTLRTVGDFRCCSNCYLLNMLCH